MDSLASSILIVVSIDISPVFSSNELKYIAETMHATRPSSLSLMQVAKQLLLAVCYKMVWVGKKYKFFGAETNYSSEVRDLLDKLVEVQILEHSKEGLLVICVYF